MSTLSNKKAKSGYEEAEAELRDKAAVSAAPRPVTIAVSGGAVTSAPNLLAAAVTGQQRAVKPRMPDPAPEPELGPIELHVNRIHVTSAPAVPVPAAASVYMNVPKHPEYVNFHDSKHQYVNVPDAQPSSKRKPFIFFVVNLIRVHEIFSFHSAAKENINPSSVCRAAAKASSCRSARAVLGPADPSWRGCAASSP